MRFVFVKAKIWWHNKGSCFFWNTGYIYFSLWALPVAPYKGFLSCILLLVLRVVRGKQNRLTDRLIQSVRESVVAYVALRPKLNVNSVIRSLFRSCRFDATMLFRAQRAGNENRRLPSGIVAAKTDYRPMIWRSTRNALTSNVQLQSSFLRAGQRAQPWPYVWPSLGVHRSYAVDETVTTDLIAPSPTVAGLGQHDGGLPSSPPFPSLPPFPLSYLLPLPFRPSFSLSIFLSFSS